jgi:hypothetical protein
VPERGRLEPADPLATPLPPAHQARRRQHIEVLGDGGLGDVELLDQLVHRMVAPGQALEDPAAGGVGEGAEDPVGGDGSFYNHMVICYGVPGRPSSPVPFTFR